MERQTTNRTCFKAAVVGSLIAMVGIPSETSSLASGASMFLGGGRLPIEEVQYANGRGTLNLPNGRKYVGDIRDGKPNGQGTMTFPDGQKYVGQFLDGQRHGQATVTFADGRRFVGEYRDDKRNGPGTLTMPNGEKYVGEYRNGEKNGQGTSYLASGEIQSSGLWVDGKFVGGSVASSSPPPVGPNTNGRTEPGRPNRITNFGFLHISNAAFVCRLETEETREVVATLTHANSDKLGLHKPNSDGMATGFFTGSIDAILNEIRHGNCGYFAGSPNAMQRLINGLGNGVPPNFAILWITDEKLTEARLQASTQEKAEAEARLRDQRGTEETSGKVASLAHDREMKCATTPQCLTVGNGGQYIGEIQDGKPNGQGVITYPNGDQYIGNFHDGLIEGQGTDINSNYKYVGGFRDGKRNGQGIQTSVTSSAKYVGEFRDNLRDGHGVLTFSDGGGYVGEFRDGYLNGRGTLTLLNGEKYVGEFRSGLRDGQGTSYLANGAVQASGLWANDKFMGQSNYEGDYSTPEAQACAVAIEGGVNGMVGDKYDTSIVRERKARIVFYGVQVTPGVFGGHKFQNLVYYVDTFDNGRITNRTNPSSIFCVLDDANNVMGLETKQQYNPVR